jgi:hypothetical protein
MTETFIALMLFLLVAAVVATLRDVHDDGRGRRQPPASHYPDPFEPSHRLRAS